MISRLFTEKTGEAAMRRRSPQQDGWSGAGEERQRRQGSRDLGKRKRDYIAEEAGDRKHRRRDPECVSSRTSRSVG